MKELDYLSDLWDEIVTISKDKDALRDYMANFISLDVNALNTVLMLTAGILEVEAEWSNLNKRLDELLK